MLSKRHRKKHNGKHFLKEKSFITGITVLQAKNTLEEFFLKKGVFPYIGTTFSLIRA